MEFLGEIFGAIIGVGANVATGGIAGAAVRFITEGIKGWQAKGDRDHEYRMRELDWRMAKDHSEAKVREIERAGEYTLEEKRLEALAEAIRAQAMPSGVKWVDGWSSAMRPGITTYFCLWYGAAKAALFYIIVATGGGENIAGIAQAVLAVWTAQDQFLFGNILGFWFVGRDFNTKK